MKKIIALAAMLLLSGCGHQGFFYASGQYTNVGFDPQTQQVGIQYVNGENVSALNKENVKMTIETKDVVDANGKQTTKIAKITYEIGETTTGYDVDLAEVNKK